MTFSAYDVIIVGGGPAGATCASACAAAGLKVVVLERSVFPREKVCGDCINPACWPVLDRLLLSERVRALPHAQLQTVEFAGPSRRSLVFPLPDGMQGEITVRRSIFDQLLLTHAAEKGATVLQDTAVVGVERLVTGRTRALLRRPSPASGQQTASETAIARWEVHTVERTFSAPLLVAADGRNSTIARAIGLLPSAARDRIGLQTHLPLPSEAAGRVVMRFLPHGYCGLADLGDGQANLCLVSRPPDLAEIKSWAIRRFGLPEDQTWRSITPLSRAPVSPAHDGLLLVGDAARVVEPFTGEGIYYALASGELAAQHLVGGRLSEYASAHRRLYRGRLWVNRLARVACDHPRVAQATLCVAEWVPGLLALLTRKVVSPPRRAFTAASSGAASG